MKNISVDITKAAQFLKPGAVEAYESQVKAAQEALENGTCPGNDFLGFICRQVSHQNSLVKSRTRQTLCVTNAK